MHTPETPRPQAQVDSPAATRRYELHIDDMHCASCVRRVEEAILAVPGVVEASVNLVEQSASVAGGDPETDLAIAKQQQMAHYLRQGLNEGGQQLGQNAAQLAAVFQ